MTAGKIVTDHAKVIEGDMREVRAAGAFADRPDIGGSGPQPLIDLDIAAAGQLHSRHIQADARGVRRAAGGDQQMGAFENSSDPAWIT